MKGITFSTSRKEIRLKLLDKNILSNSDDIINLTNDIVVKGNQYKQYSFDQVGVNLLRQMIQKQKTANKPNENKNIEIIKTAMAKLLQ